MAFDRWSDTDILTDLEDVLVPGTALQGGRYRVQSFLGCGGFGNTYIALDATDRAVVLKESFVADFCRRSQNRIVPRSEPHRVNHLKVVRSLLDEASTLKALAHPNIVRAHDGFEENGTAYLVLDLVPGQDLQQIVEEKPGSLGVAQVLHLARRLVSALAHVHERGFLHCDIAPDNVCLTRDGTPVLIDFGSARRCVRGVSLPHEGFSMVKDGFSAPELYSAKAALGPQADIYALGATLYHVIRGEAPIDSQTRRTARIDGRADPLVALAGSVQGYPPGFLASIDRALSVRAAARFPSAKDWLRALAEPAPADRSDVLVLRASSAPVPMRPAGSVLPVRPVHPRPATPI